MNSKFVLHFKLITELSLGNNIKRVNTTNVSTIENENYNGMQLANVLHVLFIQLLYRYSSL